MWFGKEAGAAAAIGPPQRQLGIYVTALLPKETTYPLFTDAKNVC